MTANTPMLTLADLVERAECASRGLGDVWRKLKRVRIWQSPPEDGTPWLADIRTFDIPETISACIRNAAPGLVAITLSRRGGRQMIDAAEAAAAERGIRVIWWRGPYDPLCDSAAALRARAAAAGGSE